ncbi:MAG: hypothetical protein K9K32_06090 [Halanaerobiales bacterium]|nr:hypothetical protein [Halanaerobiales bacterium]
MAKVIFYTTDGQVPDYITIPSLEPSESTNLTTVNVPSGSYNPDANFDIIIDFDDTVDESDETNNEKQCTIVG